MLAYIEHFLQRIRPISFTWTPPKISKLLQPLRLPEMEWSLPPLSVCSLLYYSYSRLFRGQVLSTFYLEIRCNEPFVGTT